MRFSGHLLVATLMAGTFQLALPTSAVAQGIGHSLFMRGSVVDMTGETATICVGKADGAAAGQTLTVVRVTTVPGGKGVQIFRRTNVGSIRINAIVDDHFARARIISGKVAKHDLVELRRDGTSTKSGRASDTTAMPKEMAVPGRADRMPMSDDK